MNANTFLSRCFHSHISCYVVVTSIVLAWSIPALCDPIHEAARDGNMKKVEKLIKDHPELVSSRDKYGMTPLHWAAQEDHKDVAELLLANNADVNARDNIAGWTPLHVGALEGRKDVVELLLANKADISAKNNKGETPLHIAVANDRKNVAELLRRHGGNAIPRDGLVGEWLFNGNAKDTSGNGNNGTIYGEVALTRDRFGNNNRAYKFNGIDGYIKAKADSLPRKDRTVSLWIAINSISTKPVFLAYGGGACGTSWFMGIGPTQQGGSPTVYYMSSHCDYNNIIYHFSYSPEEVWHHFAVETNASGTTMFLDGLKVASNTNYVNNTATAGTDLSLGVDISPSGCAPYTDTNVGYLYGSLDDVRIYNRALSESEIRSLYREGGWTGN
jgi:hypothetical protein